jgi:hypothetical protein
MASTRVWRCSASSANCGIWTSRLVRSLALMVALVRDPLLRLSRDFILAKYPGESVQRAELEALLATDDPDRFTPASRKSFAQNINGTWTQAGFLVGRVHKTRIVPCITPTNVTFALFLGYLEGLTGERLFASEWMNLLPGSPDELVLHANSAANRGQIVFMNAGGVKEVRFPWLPLARRGDVAA